MGRLQIVNFTSLDGVVQSPLSLDEDRDGGFSHGGWVLPYSDDVVDRVMSDVTTAAAALVLGRRSYDILLAAWAQADESDPAVAAMNSMPKHVVTSSADGLTWHNSHQVVGDLAASVDELKQSRAGNLVVLGSATLARGLAALDLVDEYRLLVFPVVLGAWRSTPW
jgi:dihydrofolate reductase